MNETHECVQSQECAEQSADDVRLPRLMRVGVKKKRIQIMDAGRKDEVTPIERVEHANDGSLPYGIEAGRSWTATTHSGAGTLVVSVTDANDAVIAFGACVLE